MNFMLDFITKWGKRYYHWGSFEVLEIRASVITKSNSFFVLQGKVSGITKQDKQVLQSGTIFVTIWGRYKKAGQILLQGVTGITKQGNRVSISFFSQISLTKNITPKIITASVFKGTLTQISPYACIHMKIIS